MCAVLSFAQQQRQDVNFYSLETEKALGRSLAADVRRDNPTVDDTFLTSYLTSIVERLEVQAHSPMPVVLDILESSKGRSEPLSLPGGYMFVSLGMILVAENEGELAGALAHGLAHIIARHGTDMARRGEVANLSTIPLIFMGGWQNGGGEGWELIPIGLREFQRQREAEADQLAAEWMVHAGYSPVAYTSYLERLQPPSLQPVAERVAAILRVPVPEVVRDTGQFAAAQQRAGGLRGTPPTLRTAPSLGRP